MILLAGSFMLYKGFDIKILSMPGVFLGIYLFAETYGMVAFNLEKGVDFLPAFGLYLLAAIAAVASPLVYLDTKSRNGRMAYYFLAIMFILVAFIALFIGSAGIVAHLASPP
jgi:Predicted membrane protein